MVAFGDSPRHSEPGLTRRRFLSRLALVGAAAGGGLLAPALPTSTIAHAAGRMGANGGALPAEGGAAAVVRRTGKLTIGLYAYVPQGIPFDTVVKKYTDRHPGVQIEIAPMGIDITRDSAAFVQRLSAEAQSRRSSYDLIVGPTTWIEVAPLARIGAIEPIEPYVPTSLLADMYEPVKKGVTFSDGKVYSMPWWADVVGLMYRRSMLSEAMGSDIPPGTWDEVVAYCDQLKARLPEKSAYGADWNQSHRLCLPIWTTMTDSMYTAEGIWNSDDSTFGDALELVRKLYPYMPASSQEDLGSSKAFQAGQVAMATYWPTQVLRAIQAGQPADDIVMTANPKGRKAGTLFWNADVVIPKYSSNKEEAGQFMNEALLADFTVEKSFENWKVVPYRSVIERNASKLPSWAQPLLAELSSGEPIPMNPYWLSFEQPIYKEEVEKMILRGQSTSDTQRNISSRIKAALNEFKA